MAINAEHEYICRFFTTNIIASASRSNWQKFLSALVNVDDAMTIGFLIRLTKWYKIANSDRNIGSCNIKFDSSETCCLIVQKAFLHIFDQHQGAESRVRFLSGSSN